MLPGTGAKLGGGKRMGAGRHTCSTGTRVNAHTHVAKCDKHTGWGSELH